ncbi:MAG: SIMPL domain-containing protein [Cyanobacteria bacterium P01_F01_bin.53]
MEHGVLRVSETVEVEIEASRAFILLSVTSDKLAFGNAAMAASEDLKAVIEKISQISESLEVETESVSTESSTTMFGKNSAATYVIKLTVHELDKLGAILGICSTGNKIRVNSILWHYDDAEEKLALIQEAVRKAKHKAEQMMAVIGYGVVGIRSCSDSYRMPAVGEIVLSSASAESHSVPLTRTRKMAASPKVDIGTQFKSKQKISATFTAEFLVQEKEG